MRDRQQPVADGDGGRQVVDRERQRGAFPDPAVEPGLDVVIESLARRGRGVVRQPVQLEVDLAAVERQRVERRRGPRRGAGGGGSRRASGRRARRSASTSPVAGSIEPSRVRRSNRSPWADPSNWNLPPSAASIRSVTSRRMAPPRSADEPSPHGGACGVPAVGSPPPPSSTVPLWITIGGGFWIDDRPAMGRRAGPGGSTSRPCAGRAAASGG